MSIIDFGRFREHKGVAPPDDDIRILLYRKKPFHEIGCTLYDAGISTYSRFQMVPDAALKAWFGKSAKSIRSLRKEAHRVFELRHPSAEIVALDLQTP